LLIEKSELIRWVNEIVPKCRIVFTLPPEKSFSDILPAGFSITDENYRWFAHGVQTHSLLVLKFIDRDQIERIYSNDRRLQGFSQHFGLNFKRAKSLLEHNGVDFSAQLEIEYHVFEMSLRELSQKHGPKEETLSKWLKDYGDTLRKGNTRTLDKKLLNDVFSKTCSIKQAADAVGVHWKTAERHLNTD